MQPDDNGHQHVIAYYSRKLNNHEKNYTTSEIECLAVVESVEHFHVYLHGTEFNVVTDHSALQWLFAIKKPTGRLYRWSVRLSVYNYKVRHRPGVFNQAPDALSRAPVSYFLQTEDLKSAQPEIEDQEKTYPIRHSFLHNGLKAVRYKGITRYVVPKSLQSKILQHYHDDFGHPSIAKTQQLISQQYWWSTISSDIPSYVRSCKNCQLVKVKNRPSLGTLQPIQTPDLPMDLWSMDTVVMGSAANQTRAKYVQVITDHHSRYVWAFATPKNTSATVTTLLTQLFRIIGSPKALITDRGTNFTSKEFSKFLADNHVGHRLTSPYHPQANGQVEKANHTILNGLRLALLDRPNLKWSTLLDKVVRNYNRTPHSSTGYSPQLLQFGLSPTKEDISVDEARRQAVNRSNKTKEQRKQIHDLRHQSSNFQIGDLVLRRTASHHPSLIKTSPANTGPYEVIRILGPETYDIRLQVQNQLDSGPTFTAHSSQLFPFVPRDQTLTSGE